MMFMTIIIIFISTGNSMLQIEYINYNSLDI
jgi:hypothetical protein